MLSVLLVGRRVLIVWIDEKADLLRRRDQFMKKLKFFWRQRIEQHCDAGDISSRPIETLNKAEGNRIDRQSKNNRNCRGCRFSSQSTGQSRRDNHIDLFIYEIRGELR